MQLLHNHAQLKTRCLVAAGGFAGRLLAGLLILLPTGQLVVFIFMFRAAT